MIKNSLKTKIILAVSTLIAIFIAVTSFYKISYIEAEYKKIIFNQQFTMVSAITDEIDNKLETAHNLLIGEASAFDFELLSDPDKVQEFLDSRTGTQTVFDNNLFMFSPSGELIAESPFNANRRGLDLSHRDYIKYTSMNRVPFISTPYLSSQHGQPSIMCTVPIFDHQGNLVAIMAGGLDLTKDNCLGKISEIKIGNTGYVYLFNTSRQIIVHPDKNRILDAENVPLGKNKLFDNAIMGFNGTDETTTSTGVESLTTYKHLKNQNWILGANYPLAEAYAPIRSAQASLFIYSIISIIIVLIPLGFIVQFLTAPLRRFTDHINNFHQKIGDERFFIIKNNDEIGALSSAFNAMIIELDKRHEQLTYLSLHDQLTGLYNRTYFENKMELLATEDCATVGIVMCDIDGLKLINDTMGHQAGDILLKNTVTVLQQCFDSTATIARIGGDEFAVLIPNISPENINLVCQELRSKVAEYNKLGPSFQLSISVGYTTNIEHNTSITELFKIADDYMYREKLHRHQSTRNQIVMGLLTALEARDFITEGHCDRMQEVAAVLAKKVGLSDRNIDEIKLLAQFHDIGKVGISDSILFKNGPLTNNEYAEMKRHSEIGFRIAQSVPDLLPIAHLILKHHEWWNGNGYPLGLKNQEIPIECRIISIVDAFDAMTNDRPYRSALSTQQAIDELTRCNGIQFDPILLEAFIKLVQEKNFS